MQADRPTSLSGLKAAWLLAFALALCTPPASAGGELDVNLQGGAFNELTLLPLTGTPGGKYLLVVSVFSAPELSFLPNIWADVGIEFLNISLGLPGFTGTFDAQGQATAALGVPFIPELDIFPLYLQLFELGPGTSKFADKSPVQTWTLQLKNSWKAPLLGSQMAVTRSTHTMTLLADGESVLVAGGGNGGITGSYGQASAQRYDLSTEALLELPDMVQPRTGHTATLLADGRVLLAGGADAAFGEPTNTAEVFDPVSGSFSAVGNMTGGSRALHRASRLPDGRVLISGGTDNYIDPFNIILGAQNTTTIFNPATDSFSAGPNMSIPRLGHSSTTLADGRVLIAGGYTRVFFIPVISDKGEIHTPVANAPGSFGPQLQMFARRFGHAATALPNGDVLLAGGATGTDPFAPVPEQSWELYKHNSGFDFIGGLSDGRILPTVAPLPDGRVLIAGGATGSFLNPVSVQTAETWDPLTQLSTPAANLIADRAGQADVALPDGTVLVSGGGTGDGTFQFGLDSVELYQP